MVQAPVLGFGSPHLSMGRLEAKHVEVLGDPARLLRGRLSHAISELRGLLPLWTAPHVALVVASGQRIGGELLPFVGGLVALVDDLVAQVFLKLVTPIQTDVRVVRRGRFVSRG